MDQQVKALDPHGLRTELTPESRAQTFLYTRAMTQLCPHTHTLAQIQNK